MFTSPKVIKGVPLKVVSFKVYEAKEKCRVQSAYPFLSPTQIKGKIRERWNKLSDEEKQNYTSFKLEKTPTKNCDTPSRKRKSTSNFKSSKTKVKKLDVCRVQQSDVRNERPDVYNNDFSESNQSDSASGSSPVFKEDNISTYQKYGNIGMNLNTPDSKKKTATQGILKTSDSAKKLLKARVSFNSPMEVNDLEAVKDPTDSYTEYTDNDFNELEDSDDDERFLIRREDTEADTADFKVGTSNGLQSETKHGEDLESVEMENLKDLDCKTSQTNGGKDEGDTDIDLPEVDNLKKIHIKQTRQRKSLSLSRKRSMTDSDVSHNTKEIFKSPLPNATKIGKESLKKKKMGKTEVRKQTPDMSLIKDQPSSQITPLVSQSKEDPSEYTTPQMDEILQQFTLNQVVRAPQKHRQAREGAGEKERIQAQLVGRHMNRSLLSPDKAESDIEKDGKIAKCAANVKPVKRNSKGKFSKNPEITPSKDQRRKSSSNKHVTDMPKTEPCINPEASSLVKNKVSSRRSLTAKDVSKETGNSSYDSTELDTQVVDTRRSSRTRRLSNKTVNSACDNEESDAQVMDTRRSSRTRRLSNKTTGCGSNNKDESDTQVADTMQFSPTAIQPDKDLNNNTLINDNVSVLDMNPSGNAGGVTGAVDHDVPVNTASKQTHTLKGGDTIKGRNAKMDHKKSNTNRSMSRNMDDNSPSYPSSTEDSQPPSSSDVSLESSPRCFNLQEITDLKKKMEGRRANNPVLERALKLLQLTSSGTVGSVCTEDELSTCSPGILSPASSGVSELSSVSSSNSRVSDDANSIFDLQSSQGTQESGLCQLFNDLTPPDQKTGGLYKTKRLLTSSTDRRSANLKEFFNKDADIFA